MYNKVTIPIKVPLKFKIFYGVSVRPHARFWKNTGKAWTTFTAIPPPVLPLRKRCGARGSGESCSLVNHPGL